MTIGRDNNLHVTFHKVSADEAAFWKGGKIVPYISEVLSFIDGFGAKFPGIEAEPGKFLQISFLHKNTRFYWNQGDSLVTKNLGYAFGMNSLQLEDTVSFNGKHLTGFVWDNNILYAIVDSKKIPVKALETSVLPPLSEIIGQNNYFSITNSSTALNGTSADFIARRKAANDAMYYGPYNLILDNMEFRFDGSEKTVLLTVYLYRGGTYYLATYQYNYTKTADGIFKFTIDNTKTNGNGNLVEADMAPLLTERFNTDHFKLDYANQQGTMIGQFISVEHPDFTFSGALQ